MYFGANPDSCQRKRMKRETKRNVVLYFKLGKKMVEICSKNF
jgi:hypothetical protein